MSSPTMDMFSSSPLMESFPSSRFPSPAPSPTRTETDLPIEVDQSFNSSMSISCAGDDASPSPSDAFLSPSFALAKAPQQSHASFLSPTLSRTQLGNKARRPDPVPLQSPSNGLDMMSVGMAKSSLGSQRTFGREISTNSQRSFGPASTRNGKGMMLPPAVPGAKLSSARPRGGIPMKWSSSNEETGVPKLCLQPALSRNQTDPDITSPRSTLGSDMDVDSPRPTSRRPSGVIASPAFSGAASFSGSPGLGSFFCDSPAQPTAAPTAKRRSQIDDSPKSPSSPSAKRASYGTRMMEKANSSSAMLFHATSSRPTTLGARRSAAKRPPPMVLSVPQSDDTGPKSASATSAYPILQAGPRPGLKAKFPSSTFAPMRRAYSVCDQTQATMATPGGNDDDESEFEDSPSMGAHNEYARRHGQKFAPRVDGSPGFKPMRSSYAESSAMSPSGKCKRQSPFGTAGLPGFGDNEMDGKILPCHKVKEDGLVRITSSTLDDLIEGKYKDKIKRYHILDCRFDYEFAGGHIANAINVKSMDTLDELLLREAKGVHEKGDALPVPSRSGGLAEGEQVVLVFHCEFSAKRAPTFAKHLRSIDRLLNNALYPKIFYPEVYILEGGYCGFWASHASRCDPKGYVPMDDPRHFERRNSDLHDFRKFTRTKSYTYGESHQMGGSSSLAGGSRGGLPCPPLAFAAASAALGRRQGLTITEEDHDNDIDSSPAPGLTGSPGYQASPTPRIVSMGDAPVFGSAKSRQFARMGFGRVQSFAGTVNRA